MADFDVNPIGLRKGGNAGLLAATTGGNDLLHTIKTVTLQQVTFSMRFVIRKIMWYNNTGGVATLRFGTLNGTPAFVQLIPTIYCVNLFDGELNEADLPMVEFMSTPGAAAGVAAAAQRNGNAYVVGPAAAGMMVAIEVEEFST